MRGEGYESEVTVLKEMRDWVILQRKIFIETQKYLYKLMFPLRRYEFQYIFL